MIMNNQLKRRLSIGALLAVLILSSLAALAEPGADVGTYEFDGYNPMAVAAETLGVSLEDLELRLEEGLSLADIARDLGIDPNVLVSALRETDVEEIEEMLAAGEISEEEAAAWRDESIVFANELVYLPPMEDLWEDETDWDAFDEWNDFEDTYGSEAFGPLPEDLAIESQRTMAYSMLDNGADPYVVIDAVLDAESGLIQQIYDALSSYEDLAFWAAEPFAAFEDELEALEALEDEWIGVVAEVLALSFDEIWDALESGETLAQLAESKSIATSELVDRLTAHELAMIDELVASGELDEEEAAAWQADSADFVQELVFEPWF